MRWALLLLMACGGSAADDWRPVPGWCCDGLCGLTGEEASVFAECTCDAVARHPGPGTRGECTDDP
jgi:hypothetical protein